LTRAAYFAAPRPSNLQCGFVPVRKKGKLPYKAFEESYDLEYGSNTIAVHTDACARQPGGLDRRFAGHGRDGGGGGQTAAAPGANILEITFLIELSFLNGRDKLKGFPRAVAGGLLTDD